MNTFMENLIDTFNYGYTENGAIKHMSTRSMVYDMFAFGGAYRNRTEEENILLFKNALEEDKQLAMKCLFYLGDCRGGQGERRFFRICFKWLAENHTDYARTLYTLIPEYRRWDDLIYSTIDTPLHADMIAFIKNQLYLDLKCKTPSLLGKWMPSENASSKTTKKAAHALRLGLGLTHKEYRVMLTSLRNKINIVETLMSSNQWDKIEFDKIPSKAGLVYKNAFARRDIIAEKYRTFAMSKETKVNASVLYPYEVVRQAINAHHSDMVNRNMIEKYWENLPDYLQGKPCKIMCVVDTSASMWGDPINVAISLGMYCAERAGGPFKDHYISFSRNPKLIKVEGADFVDKVNRIYDTNLCENTNLTGVFEMLLKIAKNPSTKVEDLPETIVVISDMEIDYQTISRCWYVDQIETTMKGIRRQWAEAGFKLPKLVYWNVDARNNTILDAGPDVSFVSGCSPVLFEQVLTGVSGYELMLNKLMSERYSIIK